MRGVRESGVNNKRITGYLERGNFFGLRNRKHALLGDGGGGGIRHFFFSFWWKLAGEELVFSWSLSNLVVADGKKKSEIAGAKYQERHGARSCRCLTR